MPVIARDAVASDHLVYAWPFPIGPEEYEVSCAEDELVVMCPAWMVGDRLGPGRHRWRTPDPMRPVSAYFVLTAPVEVSFDMITQFQIPSTGQPVRLRAMGSLQVRCMDPALLIAQFVGLPFDSINDGVLRSVSRSIERMLARLLTRRVVMAGTPFAVTDPQMLPGIVEELVAYNPAAGAVFGVELVRFGHLQIVADDGSRPWYEMVMPDHSGQIRRPPNGDTERRHPSTPPPQGPQQPDVNLLETVRSRPAAATTPPPTPAKRSGNTTPPPIPPGAQKHAVTPAPDGRPGEASGEIQVKNKATMQGHAAAPRTTPPLPMAVPAMPALPSIPSPSGGPPSPPAETAMGTPNPHRVLTTPPPGAMPGSSAPVRRAGSIEVPASTDEVTQPGVDIVRGSGGAALASGVVGGEIDPGAKKAKQEKKTEPDRPVQKPASDDGEARGSILGIGMGAIGHSAVGVASGEIAQKIAPGGRVLVPGPNGLMQSATVRQLLQGYYELEVGGSGETIWVPMNGVVPE